MDTLTDLPWLCTSSVASKLGNQYSRQRPAAFLVSSLHPHGASFQGYKLVKRGGQSISGSRIGTHCVLVPAAEASSSMVPA